MDNPISLLNPATVLTDADVLPIVNGAESKKVSIATIKSTINAVPYTNAIQDLNLGEFGLQTGNIEFDLTPTNAPTGVGSMMWNDTAGTLDLKLKGGAVTLQIGQETVVRVVNKTATNITLLEANYQAVRVTGAQGQRPKVDLALANNDLNSTTTLGLVTETILNNQEGFITTSGQVKEINTTGSLQGETWADGDILYLSGTVAGRITNIKPIAPIHTVIIGFVEYAHAVNGKIFVKVDNGYELDELHNVSAVAPNNNEVLAYDTATLLWKPKTVLNALGYYNYRNLASSSTLTGTLTETELLKVTISANTFSESDFLKFTAMFSKSGTAGNCNVRFKISTSATMPSGTTGQIALFAIATTGITSIIDRRMSIKSGNITGYPFNTSSINDYITTSASMGSATFDPTVTQYFYISGTLAVITDSIFINSTQITNI